MQNSEAYELGRTAGSLLGLLIPLSVLINAARRVQDPGYSRKCAWGMTLVASAWLLTALASLLNRLAGAPLLLVLSVVVSIPLCGVGAVLSVLGLISAGSRKGRGLSAWALVLSGIFFIALTAGFLQARTDASRVPKDWRVPELPPGTSIDVSPKGFAYAALPKPWVRVQPQRFNPNADLAFVHEEKSVFFILIAIPFSEGVLLSDEDLVGSSQQELRQLDAAAVFSEASPASAGQVAGLSFRSTVRARKQELSYRHWVSAQAKRAYILVAWAPSKSEGELDALARQAFDAFELRD